MDSKRGADLVLCAALLGALVLTCLAVAPAKPHRTDLQATPGRPVPRAASDGPPATMPPATSLAAQQIAALADSARPADAYAVYRMLAACAREREADPARAGAAEFVDHVVHERPDGCEGVEPALVARRVDWLRVAVAAGVDGAIADLVEQGPDGQPRGAVWNDPRYAGWKAEVLATLEEAADHGDAAALRALALLYGAPDAGADEDAAAIKYRVAWVDVTVARDPVRARDPRQREAGVAEAARIGAGLGPAERRAAVAAGHALAAACCGA